MQSERVSSQNYQEAIDLLVAEGVIVNLVSIPLNPLGDLYFKIEYAEFRYIVDRPRGGDGSIDITCPKSCANKPVAYAIIKDAVGKRPISYDMSIIFLYEDAEVKLINSDMPRGSQIYLPTETIPTSLLLENPLSSVLEDTLLGIANIDQYEQAKKSLNSLGFSAARRKSLLELLESCEYNS